MGAGGFAVVVIELLNEQSIATSGHLAEGGEGEREQRVFENSNKISHGAAYLGIASFPGLPLTRKNELPRVSLNLYIPPEAAHFS